MPFQRVNIRKEMETLKHLPGGHDQRTHGRRGKRGGGGGAAAIFARQKAQLDSLWLTPEQRADLESRLERASQHAAETDEMRQARLYDKDGNYTADIPTRRAFYDEMSKRGQQLAQDIQRDDPVGQEFARVMQRAQAIVESGSANDALNTIAAKLNSAHIGPFQSTGNRELDELIGRYHAYRAGMELVTRTYLAQPTPAKLNMRVSSGLNADTLQTDIAPYLHMAPPDSVRFNVESFAFMGWNAYAYYEPANVPQYASDGLTTSTVPTLYISISADASADGRFTRAHEFGHHVEHTKAGGYVIADNYTRARMGSDVHQQVIAEGDRQAAKFDNDTKLGSVKQRSLRSGYYDITEYSETVYRQIFIDPTTSAMRGQATSTEVISVFHEKLAQPISFNPNKTSSTKFDLIAPQNATYGQSASHQVIESIARHSNGVNTFAHLYAVTHY